MPSESANTATCPAAVGGSPRRRSPARPRRRGAAAVEAALVLPVVCMFLFGVLEYGRYVMMMQLLTNAAREGARYAMIHPAAVTIAGTTYGNANSDVTNAVNIAMGGQALSSQTISIYLSDTLGNNIGTWTNAQAGQSICVQISGNYVPVVWKLLQLSSTFPVSVKSVMRSESN
jgi:Flp pilus assembly protein TadG